MNERRKADPMDVPHTPTRAEGRHKAVQRKLDEALEETFPASDPVSITTSQAEEDWGAEPADAAAEERRRGKENAQREELR
ncbi:MAG: hypothetical protein DIU56_015935 [Pseudomonadota bacterium]|jgi:hypothetical protein|nr:MAG: hypothetical protein DIU56_03600 [Pseudomonadota bacterium]